MVVWSIEFSEGTSKVRHRVWFGTEAKANEVAESPPCTWKRVTAPLKHRIEGKNGLLSFLAEYAR